MGQVFRYAREASLRLGNCPPQKYFRRLRDAFLLLIALASHGLLAQSQSVVFPSGMTYDMDGNLFVSDASRNQVFEVTVGGTMVLVAGSGAQGFDGDGGPATAGLLDQPRGVALGADGTLYIADTGNSRIRAVTQGIIRTVAGSGVRGDTGDGGSSTSARFGRPVALAVAGGSLLICDAANHRVRMIADGLIQPFVGDGSQGFGGDGGAAIRAQLDSPQGIATLPDGRVIISDSHNNRVRVVSKNGIISTFAGTGIAGYAGDGGPATAARLSLPQAVSVTPSGVVIFADSNNQRVRMIDASGIITTLAGSGAQGATSDAETATNSTLNVPRIVAVSPFGAAAVGDASLPSLKAVAWNGNVYLVPAPASRTSRVALTVPQTLVYGQAAASVVVTAVSPLGSVELDEGANKIAAAGLVGGAASFSLPALSATSHALIARYTGDGLNPAATSMPALIRVQPAQATASVSPVTVAYGQSIPPLTGSLGGILTQDVSNVSVAFASVANATTDVGTYPITATLLGSASANYVVADAASVGTLTVRQAQTSIAVSAGSQTTYAGLPFVLRASVTSESGALPVGEVDFLENGTLLGKGTVADGTAIATYVSPTAGSHTIMASYLGNSNFKASASTLVTVAVSSLPDFAVQANPSSQTVQAGLIASYALTVLPQGGTFTGGVSFSVTGMPSGAVATFAPVGVVPGSAGASTTLSIQTPARHAIDGRRAMRWIAFMPLCLTLIRKRIRRGFFCIACCACLFVGLAGCGARTVGESVTGSSSQTYPLVVNATSTNLAGAVVTHTVSLSLTVQ